MNIRKDKIVPFSVSLVKQEREEGIILIKGDTLMIISLCLSFAGLFLKNNWLSWAGLFTSMVGAVNIKDSARDSAQYSMAFIFSLIGLSFYYSQKLLTY